jgi:GntR family transcriptional regulator/GntR family frlABCD operon transcriptional regulator
MERIRYYTDKPIFYDINFIPNINVPRFTSRSFENNSLFDILRNAYQVEIKGGEQKIRAIEASTTIAQHLAVKAGHPVLHLERKFDTNKSGFFIYSSIYCNTEEHAVYGIF